MRVRGRSIREAFFAAAAMLAVDVPIGVAVVSHLLCLPSERRSVACCCHSCCFYCASLRILAQHKKSTYKVLV